MENGKSGNHDAGAKVSAFIFGGCVSRDTVEFAQSVDFKVARYVARQSLLSVGSNATSSMPQYKLESDFQQRILTGDLEGNLLWEVSRNKNVDLIIWDLVVERSGVWEFADGSIATNSSELRRVWSAPKLRRSARKIDFGTREHLRRWQGAASLFVEFLNLNGLKEKTIVLAPEWAERRADGVKTGKIRGASAKRYNRTYEKYYTILEQLGVPVAKIPDTVADPNHKWGNAPFHYTLPTYRALENEIETALIG